MEVYNVKLATTKIIKFISKMILYIDQTLDAGSFYLTWLSFQNAYEYIVQLGPSLKVQSHGLDQSITLKLPSTPTHPHKLLGHFKVT